MRTVADDSRWTFLSNYAHVLLCVIRDPTVRARDIADAVGITERAVLRILGELDAAGVLAKQRQGRRNHYVVNMEYPLRHPLEESATVGQLMRAVSPEEVD